MASEWKVPDTLTFEVKKQKKATSASLFIDADLKNFQIRTYKKRIFEHDKKGRTIDASLIHQLSKAPDNDRVLTIHWKAHKSVNKKGKEKAEKYTFKSTEDRQKFTEAVTWCRYRGKIAVRSRCTDRCPLTPHAGGRHRGRDGVHWKLEHG